VGSAIQATDLRIVRDPRTGTRTRRGAVAAICLALVGTAAVATLRGADRSRSPLDARKHVADTLTQALAEGNRSEGVLNNLRRLRIELGHRPLDSKSRVRYAALLLSMTRTFEDSQAASFHARAAVELAPVTFPVVELAALILARGNERAAALGLVRHAFEYDPEAAANLLLQVEDSYPDLTLDEAVGDAPGAWIAWSRALARNGRADESLEVLLAAETRWPDDVTLLVQLSKLAVGNLDWAALEPRVQRLDPIPLEGLGRELLAYRARLHAERGDRESAVRDLDRLLSVTGESPDLWFLAGLVQHRLGSTESARDSWNRALFRLPVQRKPTRVTILVHLADLEESQGRASVALRHWRSVLEISPDHPRARRRVADLTGFEN
jgi:tetratricopeptide (TPR) repeat protein